MELPQSFSLIYELLFLFIRSVWILFDDLPPLQLRPSHEGIHGTLHMVFLVFSGLCNIRIGSFRVWINFHPCCRFV